MLWSVSRRFVRCAAGCGRLVGRLERSVSIGSGSGRRSLVVSRARTRLPGRGCPRRLGLDGSARLVGCRRSRWVRCRDVICRFPSGKRSPYFMRRVLGCVRSGVAWVVAHRRFRGSCAVTLQPVAEALSIGPRLRSGIPIGGPAARRSRSSPGNDALRHYLADRLGGQIARPDGELVPGPQVRWVGRRHGPRKDRRWATAWSPEQISNRLRVDFAR